MLRFGRHNPDFSQSDSHSVVLRLSMAEADEAFLRIVLEEETRRGGQMPIDSLIVLDALREGRRLKIDELAEAVQKEAARTRASVETLVETGLLQAHGTGRGRSYTLSSHLYDLQGKRAEYIRQAGFNKLQSEQLVKNFIQKHGRITRGDVMTLCNMTKIQAYRLLKKMGDEKQIEKHGDRKSSYYVLGGL